MAVKFHIALEVADIAASVKDYSKRFGCKPVTVVKGEYALWRTRTLNFSIRKGKKPGNLRHLGFEDNKAAGFSHSTDVNGLVWEKFSAKEQQKEIQVFYGNPNKAKTTIQKKKGK